MILVIDVWGISCKIALRWLSQDLTDDKSTLVQVMAWCCQAASHHLTQCLACSVLPYGITRPQWVNTLSPEQNVSHFAHNIYKWILLNENYYILTQISIKCDCKGTVDDIWALVQVMAWHRILLAIWRVNSILSINTVGTPYNTAPYITGSNIARLGHGSQNSWSKLWIPIVKSAPVRVIFTWKSVPKKSINGSSDIYLGTQWKQRHDSPWSYRSDVIVTFLWYGTIGNILHRDHRSTAKKV